jgi:hypothetical protein
MSLRGTGVKGSQRFVIPSEAKNPFIMETKAQPLFPRKEGFHETTQNRFSREGGKNPNVSPHV